MNAQEIIDFIAHSKKRTPVKVTLAEPLKGVPNNVLQLGNVLFGDWADVEPSLSALTENRDYVIELTARNSAVPLLDMRAIQARIEPGAIIREQVSIGKNAVIMMGAILNIGAVVGENSMIDMGAVLGGRATVGKNCHIGAGAVLAGVVEPASAKPVIIEDGVLIGANAVVVEGVHVGAGSVVAAGAIVLEDVPENVVVGGVPARILKIKDEKTTAGTALIEALRNLETTDN